MLNESFEAARAVLVKANKLREASARAETEAPAAAARADAAERAFARAHADALVESTELKPSDLEALERTSERAERDARVAEQAASDLLARLRSAHGELGHARTELQAALQRALTDAFATLLAEARAAMAPIRRRSEALRNAAGPMFGDLSSWAIEAALANLDHLAGNAPTAPPESLKALGDAQQVISELARVEEHVRELLAARTPPPPALRSTRPPQLSV